MPDNFPSLNVDALKQNNRKWKPNNCPYRLCKIYMNVVGSLWYDTQPEFFLLWNQLDEKNVLRYILSKQKPDYFSCLQSFLCFMLKPVSWLALPVSRMVFTWNLEMYEVVEINVFLASFKGFFFSYVCVIFFLIYFFAYSQL